MVEVTWLGGMAFSSKGPSGIAFVMDGIPEIGGQDRGPTPVEALVGSAAACSAIDILTILQKKRLTVDAYRLEIEYRRPEPGVFPRPITEMTVTHVLTGSDLDEATVAKAIHLSDDKYCSVIATLRLPVTVNSEFRIELPA